MKTILSFSGLTKSSVLLLGLFLAQTSFAATCIWVNSAGGSWDNLNNWSTHTVPGAGDKAYITNDATFSVNMASDITFASLTVGGTSGTITMIWKDGWITGSVALGQNAVLNLTNSSSDHILSGVITNYGRINWQQGGWGFQNGSRLENESGALVNVQCDQTVVCGGNNSVINNAGTFRKSAGAGETAVSPTPAVALNNTGTIDVESGTLNLYGSGTNNGTINVAGGAIFAMSGGTYWFGANTLFTGTGVCEMGDCNVFGKLSGATMTYSITYDVTFNTELVSGTMVWNYGNGNQSGPLTIDSNAVYNIGSGCTVYDVITNYGKIVYPAGSPMNSWTFAAPARIKNQPSGVIDLQADLRFYYDGGNIPFENAGTLLKSGGTGESMIDLGFSFTNTGIIKVQSGTLSLNGVTSTSAINVGAGAVVSLDAGDFYFGPTNIFTGTGVLDLNGWPPCGITGPLSGSAAFQMDSDANFTNCILSGTLKWINGTMDGILTVGTNGALVMINSGTMSGSITNLGQITFNPSGTNSGVTGTFSALSVGGNYTQSSGAALDMGIGGRSTDHFDQLNVTGKANLNGLLLVHIFDGFPPASSDSFQMLSYGNRSGSFSSLALPGGMALAYASTAANLNVTGPVWVQPMLLNPGVSAGKMIFGVWTANGTNYTLYRTDSLQPANWVVITNYTGDGNFWTFSLSMGSPSNRFYRVRR
jgi:hypothetical protein